MVFQYSLAAQKSIGDNQTCVLGHPSPNAEFSNFVQPNTALGPQAQAAQSGENFIYLFIKKFTPRFISNRRTCK